MAWPYDEEAGEKQRQAIEDQITRESHAFFMSGKVYDDGIIDPGTARDVVALSLRAALNAPVEETRFGVFRM